MQQRNISRPRKHKWHIFETSFWIMNWSWQPWGISRGGFFHGSEPPKMQLGDSLYECFFFRKELDNYNSISIITFSEDLCVGSYFWLFSVPLPPTMRKFQWRLRKGRRPMKQPSWISSRTRWGCGAWVDVDAFWQMFSAEIGTPRLYLKIILPASKTKPIPSKCNLYINFTTWNLPNFSCFQKNWKIDPQNLERFSTHVIGIYGDIGYVFIARGCRPKLSFCYYGWWKKSPLFTWFYTSQVVVWDFWTINSNTGKGDNPKYIKAVELLWFFVSFFQICGWRGTRSPMSNRIFPGL